MKVSVDAEVCTGHGRCYVLGPDVFASDDGRFLKGYVYGDGLWANNIKASPPEMKEWLEAIQ